MPRIKPKLLKNITRFKLGGPAKEVITVRRKERIPSLIQSLRKARKRFFILGGGTNIIASDKGYAGVIIHIKTHAIHVSDKTIECDAGVSLQRLIDMAHAHGLKGLESLSGIPGTIGGAIYGNAGAYGKEIADAVKNVSVYDGERTRTLSRTECEFDYRESIFKKNDWVILSALFVFEKWDTKALQKISKDIIRLRLQKYKPNLRCAGSIFKNIPVKSVLGRKLVKKIQKDKIIKGKIPAGYLLESVGAKGIRKGGIMVARHHANLIVNTGKGTARDAKYVIDLLKKKVKGKYGITLEEEVRYLGRFANF